MTKLSRKKHDINFIDPVTMEVRCTFNQCYKKFTIEDFEVISQPSGKEFIQAYHQCTECGQKLRAKGDGSRAYRIHQERLKARMEQPNTPKDAISETTN